MNTSRRKVDIHLIFAWIIPFNGIYFVPTITAIEEELKSEKIGNSAGYLIRNTVPSLTVALLIHMNKF